MTRWRVRRDDAVCQFKQQQKKIKEGAGLPAREKKEMVWTQVFLGLVISGGAALLLGFFSKTGFKGLKWLWGCIDSLPFGWKLKWMLLVGLGAVILDNKAKQDAHNQYEH